MKRSTGKTARRRFARHRAKRRKGWSLALVGALTLLLVAGSWGWDREVWDAGFAVGIELPPPPVLTRDEVHQRLGLRLKQLDKSILATRARTRSKRAGISPVGEAIKLGEYIPPEAKWILQEQRREALR